MAIVYGLLFGSLHPWLFDRVYPRMTHDVTVERTAFFMRAGALRRVRLVLAACNLVFDYAKVRAVVEDRRSMIGAIGAAMRFIRREPPAAVGAVSRATSLLFVVVLAVYAASRPARAAPAGRCGSGSRIGQLLRRSRGCG